MRKDEKLKVELETTCEMAKKDIEKNENQENSFEED